jgi:hypothetical protein
LAWLVLALALHLPAVAEEPCRIGFDLGSSGIRAGYSGSTDTRRQDINFLSGIWAGKGLQEHLEATVHSLTVLPEQAGFPIYCSRVGVGFSAWRLALQHDRAATIETLKHIRQATRVPVVIAPQQTEGAYGYFGARRVLGEQLKTDHVLDIGGGSLQISASGASYGAALGQKTWHRKLCQTLGRSSDIPCQLQPLSAAELMQARDFVRQNLSGLATVFPQPITMTAVSRPVSRGIGPALNQLVYKSSGSDELTPLTPVTRRSVSAAVNAIAHTTLTQTANATGLSPVFTPFLISDLILVEGLLQVARSEELHIAEAELTNLPALLADDRAYAWGTQYSCYLKFLREQGTDAYWSNPASCTN